MSINQQQLIKQYFSSLVQEFIKDPIHKDITITFADYLGGNLGLTEWGGEKKTTTETSGQTKLVIEEISYKSEIKFLAKGYRDKDLARLAVVHEFTHLYLHSIGDHEHQHDDNFYSHMEKFENWLNNSQSLTSRVDKSHDHDQHSGNSHTTRYNQCEELKCQNCGFIKNRLTNKLCDNCYQQRGSEKPNQSNDNWNNHYSNQSNPTPRFEEVKDNLPKPHSDDFNKQRKNKQEKEKCKYCGKPLAQFEFVCCSQCDSERNEFLDLTSLISDCYEKDLTILEKNWQIVKNHPLYTNSKRTFDTDKQGNKFALDQSYTCVKNHLEQKEKTLNIIRKYFVENNVKSITLEDDNSLTIRFNNQEVQTSSPNSLELWEVKNYLADLKSKGKRTINQADLDGNSNDASSKDSNDADYLLWTLGIGGFIVLVVIILVVHKIRRKWLKKRKL